MIGFLSPLYMSNKCLPLTEDEDKATRQTNWEKRSPRIATESHHPQTHTCNTKLHIKNDSEHIPGENAQEKGSTSDRFPVQPPEHPRNAKLNKRWARGCIVVKNIFFYHGKPKKNQCVYRLTKSYLQEFVYTGRCPLQIQTTTKSLYVNLDDGLISRYTTRV